MKKQISDEDLVQLATYGILGFAVFIVMIFVFVSILSGDNSDKEKYKN